MTEVRARIGLGHAMTAQAQPSRAIEILSPIAQLRPSAPYGAQALAQLELGYAYERLGDRLRASRAFNTAIASAPADDVDRIGTRARAALRQQR